MPVIFWPAMIVAGAICSLAATGAAIIARNAVKLKRLRFPGTDRKLRACNK